MDRISWKSTSRLALAAMVCLLAAPASAGITYNITNDLGNQNGWSLAGTITVSEYGTFTGSGAITAITAIDLTASNDLVNHRYNSAAGTNLYGVLSANPATLILPAGQLELWQNSYSSIQWYNGTGLSYYAVWDNQQLWLSGDFSPIVEGSLILGTAVPEIDPAGIGSVLALVTGALGLLERRRLKTA